MLRNDKKNIELYLLITVLGILAFGGIYGYRVLNPTYTDWLLTGGDLSQHYIGWQAYRQGQWQFPIGLTDTLSYPNKTSIIFTDSIPIFAVLFKTLSPILPAEFQYFGLWGIMCFILQGIFSCRILKEYTNSRRALILGSGFFMIAPVLIQRMYVHTALAGQWILLLTLNLVFSYKNYAGNQRKIWTTLVLVGGLAASIHLYFVLMCGIIVTAFCVEDYFNSRSIKAEVVNVLIYCSTVVFIVAVLGGFSSFGSSAVDGGLGMYSANLNALFNPQGWSSIFKDLLIYTDGQSEGFAYLGAGIICLMIVVVAFAVQDSGCLKLEDKKRFIAISTMVLLSVIFALSPTISIGSIKLFELHLPKIIVKLWSVFRATGRVAWIVDYTIMLLVIGNIISKFSPQKIIYVLVPYMVLQTYDLHQILVQQYNHFSKVQQYETPLRSDVWELLGNDENVEHIVPATYLGGESYYTISEWAIKHSKTMGSFALAHVSVDEVEAGAKERIECPQEDEVFIFKEANRLMLNKYDFNYYMADGYIIGSLTELKDTKKMEKSELCQESWQFSDNEYLMNGEDKRDGRHIYPGGLSYGPYWNVPAGQWLVTISGKSLSTEDEDIQIYSQGGKTRYEYSVNDISENKIELQINLDGDVENLEIVISNPNNQELILDGLDVKLKQ